MNVNSLFLNKLRNQLFWLVDGLKGGAMKKRLKEIEICINTPNSVKAKEIRQAHLTHLLNHAAETTSYYESFKGEFDISKFPVIKKTTIQDNFEAFESSKYKDEDNYIVSTSGSTGAPFKLYHDKGKRSRHQADTIFTYEKSNFKFGNRLYVLGVIKDYNKKSKLKSKLQNIIQFDISRLTDERIEEFLKMLKSDNQKNKTLIGYPSAFEIICQYLEKNNIYFKDLGLNSVVTYTGYLNQYTKTTLSKHFNIKVLSRYSLEECGIIAQQTIDSPEKFLVNHASYYLELLNLENDNPAKPGEFGRIVVTDLFNYAMPMIRYDTGDIAQLGLSEEGALEFEQIEGRRMDVIYDSTGNLISSSAVYTKFRNFYHLLKQFQFIQQGEKDYEIKLNLKEDSFEFENELINDVKSDFGLDANVIVTYIDEIPALASGKRRKVVNNFKKIS